MKRRMWMSVVAVLVVMQPAWAARTPIHDAAESTEYGRKFGGMIGRGVLNVATCFVDLLVNVVNETRNGPPVVGTLVGLGRGTGCASLRILSGGVDLVTFWVPGFNGFPVSDSYENCLAQSSAPPASTFGSSEMEHGDVMPFSSTEPPRKKDEKPRYTK